MTCTALRQVATLTKRINSVSPETPPNTTAARQPAPPRQPRLRTNNPRQLRRLHLTNRLLHTNRMKPAADLSRMFRPAFNGNIEWLFDGFPAGYPLFTTHFQAHSS